MDRNDPRRISPVPWVLIVLLGMLLAGLVFVRLFAPADGAAAPEPVETAEPTPEPTPDAAETLLADMTLREKLCQLLVVQPQMLTGTKTVTAVDDALIQALEEYPVGGILRAAEGHLAPVACLKTGENDCPNAADCITLPLWKELDRRIDGYLDSVTLADLLNGTIPTEP